MIDNSTASIEVKEICGEDRVGLVYYLFFYLPAAVVGKIFCSLASARFALFLWSFYGVVLLLLWLLHFVSRTSLNRSQTILVFVCFIAWGGMDIIGQSLRAIVLWIMGITPIRPTSWLDEWCQPYFSYYASHFTSLYWCFNQSIPLWLEMFLILSFRNIRTVGYFYCFSLLYSPWAAIGLLPIVGIMVLAVSVNVVELLCSAGLPVVFSELLAINNISGAKAVLYDLVYVFFFLLDDIIVFAIAIKTMDVVGISSKYNKYSHLIAGIIMLLIGILLLFKPGWLMFNF